MHPMKKKLLLLIFIPLVLLAPFYLSLDKIKNSFITSPLARLYVEHIRDIKEIDADHVLTTLDNGMPIIVNKHDRCVCWFIRLVGRWDSNEKRVVEKLIQRDFKIVEVGANFGVYTLKMAELVGPRGKIYAFEANPHVSKYLKMSINMNSLSDIITVYEKAAGEREGEAYLSFGTANIGGGHLIANPTDSSVKTSIVPLDKILLNEQIDVLKIDAEGYEGKILAGAKKIIERNPSLILIMEWDQALLKAQHTEPSDLIIWLQSNGFKVWRVGKKQRNEPVLVSLSMKELSTLKVGDIVASRHDLVF